MQKPSQELMEAIKGLLRYSFKDIEWNYDLLTEAEKAIISRVQFNELKGFCS